ncbi:glycoside hydrolase [Auriculariales sp. MPI-PUGE-AT-0066]|nr:glycoside hydrolase [Auriculariales sp. MPI-PUGE-AT-0066]
MAYQDPFQSSHSRDHRYPPPSQQDYNQQQEFGQQQTPAQYPQQSFSNNQYSGQHYQQQAYSNSQYSVNNAYQQGSYNSAAYNHDPYLAAPHAPYAQSRTDFHASSDSFAQSDGGYSKEGHAAGYNSYNDGANPDTPLMNAAQKKPYRDDARKVSAFEDTAYQVPPPKQKSKRRALWFWIVLFILLLAAAGACVYFFVIKPKQNKDGGSGSSSNGTKGGSNGNSGDTAKPAVFVGKDGTQVTMDNGQSFTYKNPHGGYFVDATNSDNPFNDGAKAQQWTPALNQTWSFGTDIIRGVNIGGWLVLEPFITPAYYQKYSSFPGFDSAEWTLSEAMRADTAGGGIQQIEKHYAEFITEQDFAEIAGAGLNWVRLPLPYWAIEVRDGEPFVPKTSWTYALKAFEWARKYGLRVNLDLHTIPGSQNGWNHSGKEGTIGWMAGTMGYANAQRSIDYMRIIVEFISQPQYKNVVPLFGLINEPFVELEYLQQFYLQAYTVLRGVTGIGAGNGPILSIHDRFVTDRWHGFLSGADRLALDTHKYFAFDNQDKPTIDTFVTRPCLEWGNMVNASLREFGITAGGEWSLGYNDCGRFLVGGVADIHKTTNCDFWDNYKGYNQTIKDQLKNFALTSMEGMRNFFFWTWKIAPAASGNIEAPLWSYQLGLQEGWMPTDPREAIGICQKLGVAIDPNQAFNGVFAASATGGAGAPQTLDPVATATVRPWPPTQLAGVPGDPVVFPSYTATGPMPTLPGPTLPASVKATVTGWAFPKDTALMNVPISGCTYPDVWDGGSDPVPAACPAAAGGVTPGAPAPAGV